MTEKELQEIEKYYDTIDLSDPTSIIEYGSEIQKKLSELSTRMLSQLHSQDMDDIVLALDTTVSYLKAMEEENHKFSFSPKQKQQSMKEKFLQAQQNVDAIKDTLQKHQIQLMKNSELLNQLHHMNTVFSNELQLHITAAEKKWNDCKAVSEFLSHIDHLEKRIQTLKLTQTVASQSAPLIRLVASNQITMAEKIQDTLLNTIPLWKNQMILELSMEHTLQTTSAQQQLSSIITEILCKRSKDLNTNKLLINHLSEVSNIQKQDAIHRNAVEHSLTTTESA